MSVVERVEDAWEHEVTALPQHSDLAIGKLDNGLTYVVLPNRVPAGRFEAHLEILSGSTNELESQQGMAHLLEHVAYMGSPKRQVISSTGYTSFLRFLDHSYLMYLRNVSHNFIVFYSDFY